jgi:hypothetical protein
MEKVHSITKFNPKNKKELTFEESLNPAMEITNQIDADQYFAAYVDYIKTTYPDNEEPVEEVCKSNLGYYAAYYSEETRERVERLFNCVHPFFGSIKENGPPGEKTFQIGQDWAMGKAKIYPQPKNI